MCKTLDWKLWDSGYGPPSQERRISLPWFCGILLSLMFPSHLGDEVIKAFYIFEPNGWWSLKLPFPMSALPLGGHYKNYLPCQTSVLSFIKWDWKCSEDVCEIAGEQQSDTQLPRHAVLESVDSLGDITQMSHLWSLLICLSLTIYESFFLSY